MYCVYQTDKKLEEKIFLLQCSKDEFIQNMTKAVGNETYNAKVLNGISFNDIRVNSCFTDGYYFLINKNQYQLVAKHKQIKQGILISSVWFLTDLLFTWKIFPLETTLRNTIKIEEFEFKHMSRSCSCILRGSDTSGLRIVVSDLVDDLGIDPTDMIIFSKDEENKLFYGIRYPTSNLNSTYDHKMMIEYLEKRATERSCLILECGEDHIDPNDLNYLLDKYELTIVVVANSITDINPDIYDYLFVLEDRDEIHLNLIWSTFYSSISSFNIFCQKFQTIINDYGCVVINAEPKSILYYDFKLTEAWSDELRSDYSFKKDILEQFSE
jgi:hypothetical protein